MAGERRPVTSLFADVVGSTSLAESMDPEDWSELVGEAVRRMSSVVTRYEGRVAQVLGDGIVAFFGLQPAHEDDPQRAVLAGLEMIEEMARYSDEIVRSRGVRLPIRVGVNTGTVVIRDVGNGAGHPELTALGDPVNVAARIQGHAKPGSVLVTAETYAFVAANVEARHVGKLELKGKAEPVDAWEVVRSTGSLARPRGIPGITSRMVGRDAELRRLVGLLGSLRAQSAEAAVLTGEPGIGKTRLTNELRAIASAGPAPAGWYEARCVSYGLTLPYHLVARLARSLLSLPEAEIGADGGTLPGARGTGDAPTDPYLAHLLSFELPADAAERVHRTDPVGLLFRYVEAISALLQEATRDGPAVIVCEDVHWADPASVELLVRLMPELRTLPILLLVVTRADHDAPGWRLVSAARDVFGERFVEIHLAPLGSDDGRELVSNLLEIESLPAETREHILSITDGNPLFIEEVIRMLIERGAIERIDDRWVATGPVATTDIPDSLHGLLLARIDRLPPEARKMLRIASVIGRRFPLPVLEEVVAQR
jgi:class 3 adenylate cyclase